MSGFHIVVTTPCPIADPVAWQCGGQAGQSSPRGRVQGPPPSSRHKCFFLLNLPLSSAVVAAGLSIVRVNSSYVRRFYNRRIHREATERALSSSSKQIRRQHRRAGRGFARTASGRESARFAAASTAIRPARRGGAPEVSLRVSASPRPPPGSGVTRNSTAP